MLSPSANFFTSDFVTYTFFNAVNKLTTYENGLNPAGPYAYTTFLPLFLTNPPDQPIEAYLGETGTQMLVDFADKPLNQATKTEDKQWLASQAQVILEDKDLDLAWSLSCYPQDPYLVCDLPLSEIRDSYGIYKAICNPTGTDGLEAARSCPSVADLNDFPSIVTLQLWVEQYDSSSEGNSFRSYAPAPLARVPLEPTKDPLVEDFKPWHFDTASPSAVSVTGCNYPDLGPAAPTYKVHILGTHIPDDSSNPNFTAPVDEDPAKCLSFAIPTIALTHSEVVVEYKPSPPVGAVAGSRRTPDSLVTADFRPRFGKATFRTSRPTGITLQPVENWIVDIPVSRVDFNDSLDIPTSVAGVTTRWKMSGLDGLEVAPSGSLENFAKLPDQWLDGWPSNWNQASKTQQIQLEFQVNRSALDFIESGQPIHVNRGTLQSTIAKLPDIRSLILPTKLSIAYLSPTQFAIQGPHAGIIDQVAIQGPGAPDKPVIVSTGVDYALVTLPSAPKPAASKAAKAAVKSLSPASTTSGSTVLINGTGLLATDKVTLAGPANLTTPATCTSTTNIGFAAPSTSGNYKVTVTGSDGKPIGSAMSFTVNKGQPVTPGPKCKPDAAAKSQESTSAGLTAGTYTILPLVTLDKQRILPLEVTDPNGKPLTLTVPAQPKTPSDSTNDTAGAKTTTITITKKTTPPAASTTKPMSTNTPASTP